MGALLTLFDDGGFNPRSLFASGEQGIWLDPSDFSTLFQDSAGTTPVTALGQPVGLALDKRFGLALGAELSTNDFSSNLDGWYVGANITSAVASGGEAVVTFSGAMTSTAGNWFGLLGSYTPGDFYEVVFDARYISGTAGNLQCGAGFANNLNISSATNAGVKTRYRTFAYGAASSPYATIEFGGPNSSVWAIGNVSVKKLAGNHAYQTTSAARQTAQSNYLSLDKTDDHLLVAAGGAGTTGFLLVAGVMVPAAGTARTLWSDRGTNTGYKVSIDASNQIVFSAGNGTAFTTVTGPALVAGTKYVITAWHDGANLNISVNNGAPTQAAFVTATAGTATFTIGKSNGAASEYWGDRIYGMIYRKNDTSNAGQRNQAYSYIVGKMGGL